MSNYKMYKGVLEKEMSEMFLRPKTTANMQTIGLIADTMHKIDEVYLPDEECVTPEFTEDDAKSWVANMENEDGTTGAYWTKDQTTEVAKQYGVEFEHMSDYCWWAAMNMIYSDYYNVAQKYAPDKLEFYVDMAKAFLFDKDAKSPRDKIAAYYYHIAM